MKPVIGLLCILSLCLSAPSWAQTIQQQGVIALSSGSFPTGHGGYEIDLCINVDTENGEVCGDTSVDDITCSNGTFTTRNKWVLFPSHPYFEILVDQLAWAFGHSWNVVVIGSKCAAGELYSSIEQVRVSNYKPEGYFNNNQ